MFLVLLGNCYTTVYVINCYTTVYVINCYTTVYHICHVYENVSNVSGMYSCFRRIKIDIRLTA